MSEYFIDGPWRRYVSGDVLQKIDGTIAALTAECDAAQAEIAKLRADLDLAIGDLDADTPLIHRLRDERDALAEQVRVLTEALEDVASYDCETEGCSADNPMCVGSTAKAALAAAAAPARGARQ